MKTMIYDENWAKNYDAMAKAGIAGRAGIYRLCAATLAELGENAHILIVGAGIGTELMELAARFTNWRFTAVEPAASMLEVARARVQNAQLGERVSLVASYVHELTDTVVFDGATAILVSQHILDETQRHDFYAQIARRVRIGVPFYNAELCGESGQESWSKRLEIWERQAVFAGIPPELAGQMKRRLCDEIAVITPQQVADFLMDAGWSEPLPLFRSMHYGAFVSRRVR